ncbi:alpha/beta fold hydrolase [Salinicoccus luteus]|uniref:alpha/beta fold hydrolase n=1 Tax=Salinicoccus luteus TaxID=367840 RepID=UPI0004E12EF2|nr:alpha/beta hydrolase [Salinicoccus luteus]
MKTRHVDIYSSGGHSIEYSIAGANQEHVLLLHGGHSNCHETFSFDALVEKGFTVVLPSRPGYGKTSKEIGGSLAEASAHYIDLLNHLRIEKVHVIAVSAGGPSGIHLAAKYPDRVKTLILQSAVTKEWLATDDALYRISRIIFRPHVEKATWKLLSTFNNIFPTFVYRRMFPSFSTLSYKAATAKMAEGDIEAVREMNARQTSGEGFLLDLSQTGQITEQYLQNISCPTLIIHSRNDASVPTDHPIHAHENIPDSRLIMTESWGHLIWLGKHAEEIDEAVVKFLEHPSGGWE